MNLSLLSPVCDPRVRPVPVRCARVPSAAGAPVPAGVRKLCALCSGLRRCRRRARISRTKSRQQRVENAEPVRVVHEISEQHVVLEEQIFVVAAFDKQEAVLQQLVHFAEIFAEQRAAGFPRWCSLRFPARYGRAFRPPCGKYSCGRPEFRRFSSASRALARCARNAVRGSESSPCTRPACW